MRTRAVLGLLLVGVAAGAAAGERVLPIFALRWPGKDGNRWSSEVFMTNPGPATVRVSGPQFLPGVVNTTVPCFPPVPAYRDVPPYRTVMLTASELSLDLGCPESALGGLAFDADAPVLISSRVVNDRGFGGAGGPLSGLGQDVPALAASELTLPGGVYQLPALLWDPFRCAHSPLFEVYIYLANPGSEAVEVTLQQSRTGQPGELVINGVPVPTPHVFELQPRESRQLKVELGGALPAVCLGPQVVDLFLTVTGGVAVVGSVVDRSSQDPRTVLPVRTSQ
jgi:hypothetical protein